MQEIKVILFDDSPRIRESLTMLFKAAKGIRFCGAFPDCNTLMDEINHAMPDVVLMDIDMPGMNGIEATRMLKATYPDMHIIMLTAFNDDEKIYNAIVAGADGYILKNTSLDKLLHDIIDVQQGGAPMTPSIARKVLLLFQQSNRKEKNEVYDFTPREQEVLSELVKGASYKMIADKLGVTYDTVHTYIKRIYKKLQVNSMSEAVAKAINNRLT